MNLAGRECTAREAGKQIECHPHRQDVTHGLSQQPHVMRKVRQDCYHVHLECAEGHLACYIAGRLLELAILLAGTVEEMAHKN